MDDPDGSDAWNDAWKQADNISKVSYRCLQLHRKYSWLMHTQDGNSTASDTKPGESTIPVIDDGDFAVGHDEVSCHPQSGLRMTLTFLGDPTVRRH
jgi:hypothetical protein